MVLATCIWLMISVYGIKRRNQNHQVKMIFILFGKEVALHLMEEKRTTTSQ